MTILPSCTDPLMRRFLVALLFGASITLTGATAFAPRADAQEDAARATHGDMLPEAQGTVILHVSGQLARGNLFEGSKPIAEFDLDMLRHFEAKTVLTSTIWSSGQSSFRGVPLSAVLRVIGAEGRTLRLTALNDYTIDMPVSMIEAEVPILAYEMNGALLSARDKGPLWVIYPFDSESKYQNEESYSRAVWQLVRIEVLP